MSDLDIKLEVGFDERDVNDKLQTLLKNLQGNNKLTLDFDGSQLNNINENIKKIVKNVGNIDFVKNSGVNNFNSEIEETNKKITQIQKTIGSTFTNVNINKKTFEELENYYKNIKENVDKLAKIKIINDDKGEIKNAYITYKDGIGNVVKETLGWKETQNKVNDEITKTKTFKTITTEFTKDLQKINSELNNTKLETNQIKEQKLFDKNSFVEVGNELEKIKQKYEKLGSVNITTNKNVVTKEIESINVELKKADGIIQKIKYDMVSLDGKKGFAITNLKDIDKTADTYEKVAQKVQQINKKVVDDNIKELEKLEKEIDKIEQGYHNLTYLPNDKQSNINDLRGNIGNLKNTNGIIDKDVITNIIKEVEQLGKSYERINEKDLAEGRRRSEFYDTFIAKQKELNNLKLKQLNSNVTDNENQALQDRINQLNKEIISLKSNPNNYYKKEVSSDNSYKDMMQQYNYQLKIKQAHLEDTDLQRLQKQLYSELTNLQKEEYSIKNKLIGVDDEQKSILQAQLNITKQQQAEIGKLMNQYKAQNSGKNNDLLIERKRLTSELTLAQTKYNNKIKEEQKDIDTLANQTRKSMQTQIQNLQTKYRELTTKSGVKERIEELQSKLNNLNATSLKDLRKQVKDLNNDFKQIEADTKASGNVLGQRDNQGWMTTFTNQIKKFSSWYLTGGLVVGTKRAITSSIAEIKDVDSALVDLSKVVDISKSKLDDMRLSALDLGRELGKSSVEIIQGMSEFGRVTKNLEEIKELTKVSTMASNVTDLKVEDAAKALNTSMVSFNINAKDSMHILDSFNEIQNNFRVSAEGLAESIGEVGSAAKQAGVSLEELEGYTTAIVSATGAGGAETGTAIKGMISRTFRLGKDGIEDAGKTEEALNKIGVKIRNSSGDFRKFNDILVDTKAKFDDLSKVEQMHLAQQIGGTHYYSKFLSLMENFNIATDATSKAVNSQGSALDENQKYINSVSGQLEILKTNLEAIKQSFLTSDDLHAFLSIGNGITNLIGKIGGLKTALFALYTVFLNTKKTTEWFKEIESIIPFTRKITDRVNDLSKSLANEIDIGKELQKSYMENNISTTELTKKLVGLETAQKAVAIGSKALHLALTMGLSIGLTLVSEQIIKLIHSYSTLKQKNEEVLASYKENVKANNDMIQYLKTEGVTYTELSNKITLTTEEQKKLAEIKERIGNTFPDLIQGYNKETGEIELQKKSVSELIQLLKEKQQIENSKILSNGDNIVTEVQKELKKAEKKIELYKKSMEAMQSGQFYFDGSHEATNLNELKAKLDDLVAQKAKGIDVNKELAQTQEIYNKAMTTYGVTSGELKIALSEQREELAKINPLINAIIDQYSDVDDVTRKIIQNSINLKPEDLLKLDKGDFSPLMADIKEQIETIQKDTTFNEIKVLMEIDKPKIEQIQEYFRLLFELAQRYKMPPMDLARILPLKADSTTINKAVDDYVLNLRSALSKATSKVDKQAIQGNIDMAQNFKISIQVDGQNELNDAKTTAEELKKEMEDLQKAFDDTMETMNFYKSVMKEINENHQLSQSTIQNIIDKHSELTPYINDTTTLYQKLKEKLHEVESQADTSYTNMMLADANFAKEVYKNTEWLSKMKNKWYGIDFDNFTSLGKGKVEAERNIIKVIAGMWADYYDLQSGKLKGDVFAQNELITDAYGKPVMNNQNMAKMKEAYSIQNEIAKKYKELANDMRNVAPKIDFSGLNVSPKGGKKKGSKKEASNTIYNGEQLDKYQARLKTINEYLEQRLKLEKDLKATLEQYEALGNKRKTIEYEEKLLKQQQSSKYYLKKSYTDSQKIANEINNEFKKNFGKNLTDMSESGLTNLYNQKFGKTVNFGNDKKAKDREKAFQNQAKKFKDLAKDYEQAMNDHLKYIEQYSAKQLEILNTINKIREDYKRIADENVENLLKSSKNTINKDKEKISLLGELDTEADKKAFNSYFNEIKTTLDKETLNIDDRIKVLKNAQSKLNLKDDLDKLKYEGHQYEIDKLLENESEILNQAKEIGSQFADNLIKGYDEQIQKQKDKISLLGNIDTLDEKNKQLNYLKEIGKISKSELSDLNGKINTINNEINKKKKLNVNSLQVKKDLVELNTELEKLTMEKRKIKIDVIANDEDILKLQKDKNDMLYNYETEVVEALKKKYEKELELAKEEKAKELLLLKNLTKEQERLIKNGEKTRLEIFEETHEKILKALNDELKSYEDIYNAKIKEIDRKEETDDYDKELNKKQQEKLKVQSQYDSLLMDNSIEAQGKRIDLLEDIKNKEEEINEFIHDRNIKLRKQNLQDEFEERKKAIQDRIDKENEAYKKAKVKYDEEVKALEDANKKKLEIEKLYAEARLLLMEENFTILNSLLQDYGKNSEKIFSSIGETIKTEINDNLKEAIELTKEINGKSFKQDMESRNKVNKDTYAMTKSDRVSKDKEYSVNFSKPIDEKTIKDNIKVTNKEGKIIPIDIKLSENKKSVQIKPLDKNGYKTGEYQLFVSKNIKNKDGSKLGKNIIQNFSVLDNSYNKSEIIENLLKDFKVHKNGGLNTDTGFHWLDGTKTDPELVLNAEQTKAMLDIKDYLPKLNNFFKYNIPSVDLSQLKNDNDTIPTIEIDKLINVEGNVSEKDIPKIEMAGNNALSEIRKELNKRGFGR